MNMQRVPECTTVSSCPIGPVVIQLMTDAPSGIAAIIDYVLAGTLPSPVITAGIVGSTR